MSFFCFGFNFFSLGDLSQCTGQKIRAFSLNCKGNFSYCNPEAERLYLFCEYIGKLQYLDSDFEGFLLTCSTQDFLCLFLLLEAVVV